MKLRFQLFCALALVTTAFSAPPDVSGKWKWIYERDGEPLDVELNLTQEGSKLSGKILAPENRVLELREGQISDDGKLSFHVNFERDSGPLRINFAGKADGDKITGQTEYTNDEGEKQEREWNPKREQQRSNLSGKWISTFKRSDGTPMETTLEIKQLGEKLTGTQSFNENETELRDGKVVGDEVTFRTVRERDGRTVTARHRGKIQKDNSIKGEIESDWTGEVRRLEWEAKKAK
jgi:hypothetical protein